MASSVPNRAGDPKRKVYMSHMTAERHTGRFSGEPSWAVSHPDSATGYYGVGHTKKTAMRAHKENMEKGLL